MCGPQPPCSSFSVVGKTCHWLCASNFLWKVSSCPSGRLWACPLEQGNVFAEPSGRPSTPPDAVGVSPHTQLLKTDLVRLWGQTSESLLTALPLRPKPPAETSCLNPWIRAFQKNKQIVHTHIHTHTSNSFYCISRHGALQI